MLEQRNPAEALTVSVLNSQSQVTNKPLRDSVKQALKNTRGNQTRAATMLGINRGTLRKKLKKYGMG